MCCHDVKSRLVSLKHNLTLSRLNPFNYMTPLQYANAAASDRWGYETINYDTDFESFAASPPAPEDSFFYLRYPKAEAIFGQAAQSQQQVMIQDQGRLQNLVSGQDWSKHTKQCQDVIHGISGVTAVNPPVDQVKVAGAAQADDTCGDSVVKVATKMISTRSTSQRGFIIAAIDENSSESAPVVYHGARRGSKSLPATPSHSPPSSPNSRRKKNGNKYFTSPFEPVEDGTGRSWLAMALLGYKKDLTTSTSTLAEEDALEVRLQGGTLAESVESLGPAPRNREVRLTGGETATQQPKHTKPAHNFLPKPSELREMNFWSPTSM
ncbi:hypothetical protein EVAR_65248_1 [Eumeta japonica]|uniref:Uncharacterized protein n=1 Tax=Eumeta variegata TaxID=151549 RepID=A0A4C1ZVB0_EUMVA|nr:hypothetical protein EVAR_65248_1 [Eumeta japonica]